MSFADDVTNQNPPHVQRVVGRCLGALDVDGAGTPVGVLDVKRHGVALAEFVIGDIDESGGMKERVFLLACHGDEPEPLVGQSSDCTCHKVVGSE